MNSSYEATVRYIIHQAIFDNDIWYSKMFAEKYSLDIKTDLTLKKVLTLIQGPRIIVVIELYRIVKIMSEKELDLRYISEYITYEIICTKVPWISTGYLVAYGKYKEIVKRDLVNALRVHKIEVLIHSYEKLDIILNVE